MSTASAASHTEGCDDVMPSVAVPSGEGTATTHSDRAQGVLTSTLNLWKWIMDLETAGDDGDLGKSHNDPS